ncbi:MAG: alpha/beta fold hydrolase [Proteobacteria bacterium]|nr:alpha/beta fold hydrolase [Burkholderiales bacterium]
MTPSTARRSDVDGAAGRIEVKLNDPGGARRGIAVVAHPHPLFGGTNENKVVTTLARVFFDAGYVVARPNFRGVGASEGVHDEGIGETDDLVRVVEQLREGQRGQPALLAGFSFGGFVASRVAARFAQDASPFALVVLVAPAVGRFAVGPVPPSTVVIHGEDDDVVPLRAVFDWARPQALPVSVIPGTGHFFHGRLPVLARLVRRALASAAVE